MRREDAAGAKATIAALGALVLLLFLPLYCCLVPAAYTAGPCALLGNSLTHFWGWRTDSILELTKSQEG